MKGGEKMGIWPKYLYHIDNTHVMCVLADPTGRPAWDQIVAINRPVERVPDAILVRSVPRWTRVVKAALCVVASQDELLEAARRVHQAALPGQPRLRHGGLLNQPPSVNELLNQSFPGSL